MSILIKGIGMPHKNEITLLTIYPDGTVRQQTSYVHGVTDCICPNAAIEIPKHGRLIDADVLQNNFEWFEKVTSESNAIDKAKYEQLTECDRMVKKMPTIIEGDAE